VEKSQTDKLLECGDLVLANDWEGVDFHSALNDGTIEEEYNYDESSDDDSVERGGVASFVDQPVDLPPNNLIELTHLHEPSVVHALRHRYRSCNDDLSGIYTDNGPILLAVNPFKSDETGNLYGEKAIERYRLRGEKEWLEKREGENGSRAQKNNLINQQHRQQQEVLGPHVYAVADRTFRTMMSSLHPLETGSASNTKKAIPGGIGTTSQNAIINQSVLVSGESGEIWMSRVCCKLMSKQFIRLKQTILYSNRSWQNSNHQIAHGIFS
jgi:hypothetical protein